MSESSDRTNAEQAGAQGQTRKHFWENVVADAQAQMDTVRAQVTHELNDKLVSGSSGLLEVARSYVEIKLSRQDEEVPLVYRRKVGEELLWTYSGHLLSDKQKKFLGAGILVSKFFVSSVLKPQLAAMYSGKLAISDGKEGLPFGMLYVRWDMEDQKDKGIKVPIAIKMVTHQYLRAVLARDGIELVVAPVGYEDRNLAVAELPILKPLGVVGAEAGLFEDVEALSKGEVETMLEVAFSAGFVAEKTSGN